MQAIRQRWTILRDNSDGITAIEYALMTALLTVAIVTGTSFVATNLNDAMSKVTAAFVTKPKLP